MGKTNSTIDLYFKRKRSEISEDNTNEQISHLPQVEASSTTPVITPAISTVQTLDVNPDVFERDPGLRKQIWEYPVEQRYEIRRRYIEAGPYQPKDIVLKRSGSHSRRFQTSWYDLYPSWLEYSPAKDAAFCFCCFLFNKPHGQYQAFTIDGFRNWKKARNGQNCAFLSHIGKEVNSLHKTCEKNYEDLMNQAQVQRKRSHQIAIDRMRLKVSIDAVLFIAFQGYAFDGLDESVSSIDRGDIPELMKLLATNDEKVANIVAEHDPSNASYISTDTQKEILQIVADRVRKTICDDIEDAKFCVVVDEGGDIANTERMAIVLRYVDKCGLVKERFFGLVHVSDTSATTLKDGMYSIFSRYSLNVQNIRGQGYDGASNMRDMWNELQASVKKDCPYAYHIHCFAHRLELALIAASKDVIVVYRFFSQLNSIANLVLASYKRNDELKAAFVNEISYLLVNDQLETGTRVNQIGTLQRLGDTCWWSNFKSISSLIRLFDPTRSVLDKLSDEAKDSLQGREADKCYEDMTSFDFVFILHLMSDIMETTDKLCQTLQNKSHDVLNTLQLISSTKTLLQKLRDDGGESLIAKVKSFCESRNIDIPDMSSLYIDRRGYARNQPDHVSMEHHYRVDIFYATIDAQLQELNSQFNVDATALLALSYALDPRKCRNCFNVDEICKLVSKFYPEDFTELEQDELTMQLRHYELEISMHPDFQNLSTISELCRWLVETRKSVNYSLIYRLIKLVLTLPVSTVSNERAFSAMNFVKTKFRGKMEDGFLENSTLIYMESEIAKQISIDSIIDEFWDLKERRTLLQLD